MDERLEKALAFSNYRITIENRRKAIQRRFEAMTVVYKNNGMFKANQETIAFINALIQSNHQQAIVLDSKSNPIIVENLQEFVEHLIGVYFAATNELMDEMKKLSKARDIKKVVDW